MNCEFEYEGKIYHLQSQKLGEKLWVHFQGKTYCVDTTKTKSSSRTVAAGNSKAEIHAPMPGKITKLLKNAGEPVERGESVVVMEAMKMEYTLKSEALGLLMELNVKVGDQVELGFLIAKILEKPG
jgi:acetyl/propionyl-CoA carboxylase alpha subunit